MTVDELVENFELLDDWEDRYRYIIELGKALPALSEAEKNSQTKVEGCMSQVWMVLEYAPETGLLHFRADSDAVIVKGLIGLLRALYDGLRPSEILAIDALEVMGKIGLDHHLSPNRRNGFVAMVGRLQQAAQQALLQN